MIVSVCGKEVSLQTPAVTTTVPPGVQSPACPATVLAVIVKFVGEPVPVPLEALNASVYVTPTRVPPVGLTAIRKGKLVVQLVAKVVDELGPLPPDV